MHRESLQPASACFGPLRPASTRFGLLLASANEKKGQRKVERSSDNFFERWGANKVSLGRAIAGQDRQLPRGYFLFRRGGELICSETTPFSPCLYLLLPLRAFYFLPLAYLALAILCRSAEALGAANDYLLRGLSILTGGPRFLFLLPFVGISNAGLSSLLGRLLRGRSSLGKRSVFKINSGKFAVVIQLGSLVKFECSESGSKI